MKYKTRLRIEYGTGCIIGWLTPALLLASYTLRGDTKFDVLFFLVYTVMAFSVAMVVAAALSLFGEILTARNRRRRIDESEE